MNSEETLVNMPQMNGNGSNYNQVANEQKKDHGAAKAIAGGAVVGVAGAGAGVAAATLYNPEDEAEADANVAKNETDDKSTQENQTAEASHSAAEHHTASVQYTAAAHAPHHPADHHAHHHAAPHHTADQHVHHAAPHHTADHHAPQHAAPNDMEDIAMVTIDGDTGDDTLGAAKDINNVQNEAFNAANIRTASNIETNDIADQEAGEVQILGVYESTSEDGVNQEVAILTDGEEIAAVVDMTGDGYADVIAIDENQNLYFEEEEIHDISDANFEMEIIEDAYVAQQAAEYSDSLSDYEAYNTVEDVQESYDAYQASYETDAIEYEQMEAASYDTSYDNDYSGDYGYDTAEF